MKKRFLIITILLVLMALSLVLLSLTGCTQSQKEVTGIRVDKVEIFMGPKQNVEIIGDPSTYKINATVLPTSAKNKEIYFKYVDPRDQQYLEIDSDGTLRARKVKYRKEIDEEFDEEVDVPDVIYINVLSRDNPKISVKLSIIIEEVEVKKIYFTSDMFKIYYEDDENLIRPQKAEIVFEPAHAVIGRELEFIIANSAILSVNQLGLVMPQSIGATLVTARQTTGRTRQEAFAVFKVIYPSLQYDMRLDSPLSALKRSVGETDSIEFSLVPLHEKTDPSPDIMWYINDSAINVRGAKDSLKLKYDMSSLPVGEYTIKALLSNNEQSKELNSSIIKIYYPIQNIRVSLLNETISMVNNMGSAEMGDMLRFAVTRKSDEYPAEGYNWVIKKPNGTLVDVITYPLTQDTIGGIRVADMNYTLSEPGEYEFEIQPIVKGVPKSIRVDKIKIVCNVQLQGNNIKNLLVEGKKDAGGKYLPYVTWKKLPSMRQDLTVEVRKGESGNYTYQTFEVPANSSSFDGSGMFISDAHASLNEDFSVRVRGANYGWTSWYEYKAAGLDYKYFDVVYQKENAYISNIEDFAALLNDLVIYKPLEVGFGEALEFTREEHGELVHYIKYELELAVPYSFPALERSFYFPNARLIYEEGEDSDKQQLFADMLIAALDTYVESTSMYDVLIKPHDNQDYVYDFKFSILDLESEYDSTVGVGASKLNFDRRVFDGNPIGASLPIDLLEDEKSVFTSNQLYYAALNSYKPIPVLDSPADKIYKIARWVIESIIKKGMTREEMAFAIYDYVASTIVYDYELAALSGSGEASISQYDAFYLEGVFKATFTENGDVDEILQGKAVCDGISKAVSLLLSMCGIENARQTGVVLAGELGVDIGHVWNLVSISGQYYALDATWALREINYAGETRELTTRKYLLSVKEEMYGERGEKVVWFGKFSNQATKSLLSGFNYVIGEMDSRPCTKYIETEEQFNYIVLEYFMSQVSGENNEIFIEVMFDKSITGFLFEMYLESDLSDETGVSYSDYIAYSYYKIDVVDKAVGLISMQSYPMEITYLSEDTQNLMTFKIVYNE